MAISDVRWYGDRCALHLGGEIRRLSRWKRLGKLMNVPDELHAWLPNSEVVIARNRHAVSPDEP